MSRNRLTATVLISACLTTQARADQNALFTSVPLFQSEPTWQWVIGAAIVSLIVGFALGWRMLDRRIRKKYGGLKIY